MDLKVGEVYVCSADGGILTVCRRLIDGKPILNRPDYPHREVGTFPARVVRIIPPEQMLIPNGCVDVGGGWRVVLARA